MNDVYDLARFVEAQDEVYSGVLSELEAGAKTGHWIWFVFPQVSGLGRSEISEHFAISSLDEARAYLSHPVLGPRLLECTNLALATEGRSAEQIFGAVDAMKFRSCMTLFARADADRRLFQAALDKYFDGIPDPLTTAAINTPSSLV